MQIHSKKIHKIKIFLLFCFLLSLTSCEFQTGVVEIAKSSTELSSTIQEPSDDEDPSIQVEPLSAQTLIDRYGEHYRKVVIQSDRIYMAHQAFQITNTSGWEMEIKISPASETNYQATLERNFVYDSEKNSVPWSTCYLENSLPSNYSETVHPLQSPGKTVLLDKDWFIHQQNLDQTRETNVILPASGSVDLALYYLSNKDWNEIDPGMVYQRTVKNKIYEELFPGSTTDHCAMVEYLTEISRLVYPKVVQTVHASANPMIFKRFKGKTTWHPYSMLHVEAAYSNP